MDKPLDSALVWLRRDLRVDDNAALHRALTIARRVWCVFVFDTDILDALPRADRRVAFIRNSLVELDSELGQLSTGARLLVRHGRAVEQVSALAGQLQVDAVIASHDDEPAALARDADVREALRRDARAMHTVKDHLIFERSELLTKGGGPYSVFTPYRKAWMDKVDAFYLKAYPVQRHASALAPPPDGVEAGVPDLGAIGFEPSRPVEPSHLLQPGSAGAMARLDEFLRRIDDYGRARDYPAIEGTSTLSVHLRFGTVSIRRLAREALARSEAGSAGAAVWLSELIWRDFYHQVLHHHPHVVEASFKPAYDRIEWESGAEADRQFAAWCEGRTGYPLVDAAMAQINQTGFMHNRLRMVTASFLVKDLGIDWRRGEAWFAQHLNDYDLAANNGGWQWASSSGCDAQPYFRIFNPISQSRRFDPDGSFIRRWLPQLARLPDRALHEPSQAPAAVLAAAGVEIGRDYPAPIVDHDEARRVTLRRYAVVRSGEPAQ